MRTCLEYIYSMGLGELEFMSTRHTLSNLKQTAQLIELADLVRLVDMILEREPPPAQALTPPTMLPPLQPSSASSHLINNHIHNNNPYQHQQQLSQLYTNLMIEQLLKKLCREQQQSNSSPPPPPPQQQTQSQQSISNQCTSYTSVTAATNSRFASLFNKSKIDLSRFENDFELDTISRDLVIKDKYVYPSQDLTTNFLDACFENSVLINLDLPPPGLLISNLT